MARARALTVDMGGTLDGPGVAWRPRLERLYREAGVIGPDAAGDEFRRAFFDADDRLADRHALAGLGLGETVRLQVEDTLANLGRRDTELARRIAGAFTDQCRSSLRRSRRVLALLARRYPLGVVSNFYGNLRDVLRGEGLLELFREPAVIDSRDLRVEKPDARIFHAACAGLGAEPGEVAHVGDSWHRDVMGARGAGLMAVWLAPRDPSFAVARSPSEPARIEARVVRIERLEDLQAALEGAFIA